MKPKVISTCPPLGTSPLLAKLPSRVIPGFYSARMTTLPARQDLSGGNVRKLISNTTNHINFYNKIAVKISLFHSCSKGGYPAPGLMSAAPDAAYLARALIDHALRAELDRETAVMARGEDVAQNQRRQRMLGRYLSSKPYQVIRRFYSVQKLTLVESGARTDDTAFHSDIIHERTNRKSYSSAQTHTEPITRPASATSAVSETEMNRIANQVVQKVEKRMRTERERSGKW